jgi:hypothetical protein
VVVDRWRPFTESDISRNKNARAMSRFLPWESKWKCTTHLRSPRTPYDTPKRARSANLREHGGERPFSHASFFGATSLDTARFGGTFSAWQLGGGAEEEFLSQSRKGGLIAQQPVEKRHPVVFQPRQVQSRAPHGSQNNDLRRYFGIASMRP